MSSSLNSRLKRLEGPTNRGAVTIFSIKYEGCSPEYQNALVIWPDGAWLDVQNAYQTDEEFREHLDEVIERGQDHVA